MRPLRKDYQSSRYGTRYHELVAPALKYIKEHYTLPEKLDAETLAAKCGISAQYLRKLFAGCYGVSLKDYVINLRPDHAVELMIKGGFGVETASDMCGFNNAKYFSRFFKERYGMRFGLWFEPEMVNPDSDLYRAHPDWILHAKGRQSSLVRNQLTLDLSRKDVCDYITEAVSDVLNKANIEYVKWDMNRYMSEVGSSELPADRQGEVKHRYMLGLYSVLETLTQRFPNVLFESCASGGGRFDPGMLYYMPQTWTSDDSDAAERLRIQYGTSIVYPYSSMGAHVSAVPNHQIGRITSFEMRCDVALPGQFGFELDLNKCTDHELEIAKKKVREYRELQEVFHKGDCYRLKSPFETDLSAVEFVSEDKKTAVVCISSYKATAYSPDEFIKPQGLCENATYRIGENSYDGKYLMNYGIVFRNDRENKSEIIVMHAE